MQNNGTAVPDQREAGQVSPVIGHGWPEDGELLRPLVLRVRLSVSAEEMATALYGDDFLSPADLAVDEHVWGCAAVAIVQDGLDTIECRVAEIRAAEAAGTLTNPGWLALCRRRVAEVTGGAPDGQDTSRAAPAPTAGPGHKRPAAPGAGLASVRALTEIAAPCRAGC